MTGELLNLDDVSPSWLADQLDDRGVVRLPGAVSEEWLAAMRASVTNDIAANGDGDFYLDQADQRIDSPAHRLTSDPAVRRLFTETTDLRRRGADWPDDVLRCSMLVRTGTTRKAPSYRFHYDPCVLTMVVPIFIPHAAFGTGGELAAMPNARPFRRFVGTHLVDTLGKQNPVYRHHVTTMVHHDPDKYVVPLSPGDAYLFRGYRTFHGNLGCAPGLLRTTLVLKFGRVHSTNAWASRIAWGLSRSRRDLRRFSAPAPHRLRAAGARPALGH